MSQIKNHYNSKINLYLGDCSSQKEIPEKYGWCRFTHSWYPDSTDLLDVESLGLVNGVDKGLEDYIKFYAFRVFYVLLLPLLVLMIVVKICTSAPTK